MLYSKVDMLAFAIVSVAVALCSLAIKGTQWRSQKFWTGDQRPKASRTRGGMWEEVSSSPRV